MKKTIAWLLFAAIYTGMFAPFGQMMKAQQMEKAKDERLKEVQNGLRFSLSEGVEGAENREVTPPANAEQLNPDETSGLLKRVPELKTEDGDKSDFAKRAGSLPAPKTGERIPVKFPADETRDAPNTNDNRSLEVVRFSPEGEVALAPDLSVSFSHPMVSVTSQEDAAKTVPVTLSPAAEGKWRWLGTKTLMFDTTTRFRMATKYTATVPAGTKSATGQVLDKAVEWSFTTPPPKVVSMYPQNQTTRRDSVMFLSFDQEINPSAVLENLTVSANGKPLQTRLLTEDEIKSGSVAYYASQAEKNRWLAFRAVNSEGGIEDALPGDSAIQVSVNKGTPSAEGPLTTTAAQSYSYRTYGAMKFVAGYCGYQSNKDCSPFENWHLQFSNSIDSTKFDKSMIKISPAVEGLNIYPSGNGVYIQGVKKGRTTYTITMSEEIGDVYGQNLGADASTKIKVGSAPMTMYAQGGNMVVLDPTATKPAFSLYSTNHETANMKVYRVAPQDWSDFQQYVRYRNYDDGNKKMMPGALISNRQVTLESKPDEVVETRVDLAKFLRGGFGNVVLDIEPTKKRDKYDRTRILVWIQSTQMGLDAFVDNEELVGFATQLKDGKPIPGVNLSIYPNGTNVVSNAKPVEDSGYLAQAWEWLKSWGYQEPNDNIRSIDQHGRALDIESIDQAQSNTTPANGVLRLPLPTNVAGKPNMLIAKKGNDIAFLPENTDYYWRETGTWYKKTSSDYLRWFVFDDRKMYRPKEEVSVKGYVRKITAGKLGDVASIGDVSREVGYVVYDPRNNEIGKGTVQLNAFGAFDFQFKLPDNANLGYSRVELTSKAGIGGQTYNHGFQIQEFRRPEFEVSSRD